MVNYKKVIKTCYLNIWTLITACSFVLISCDCGYVYEFIVENKTSSELKVYCKAEYCCGDGINKTVTIEQDTSAIIWSSDAVFAGGGCPGPFKENCTNVIDSIFITMNDSMTTKLNYKDVNGWTFTSTGNIRSTNSKGTYKISLTDIDFILLKGN